MSTSAIPDVIDALVTACTSALTNISVYDGWGVSDDPGDFLMIGVDDPDANNETNSGSSQQDWANATGTKRNESGDISCAALSWNGDSDQKAARTAVFATTAAVEDVLRSDYTLGLPTLLWTSYGTSTQLTQSVNSTGAMALVVFKVHFEARI